MLSFVPLPEQERALDLFHQGKTLRVDAYAGTGKTATLRLLATSSASKGLYLAAGFFGIVAAGAGGGAFVGADV